jgi:hypothetical protein
MARMARPFDPGATFGRAGGGNGSLTTESLAAEVVAHAREQDLGVAGDLRRRF